MRFLMTLFLSFHVAQVSMASSNEVSGIITVDQEVVGKMPMKGSLFLFAKAEGATGEPPVAVKKIESPRFPLEFSLGPKDVMIPGTELKGPLQIVARLSPSGNALDTKGVIEGDVRGQLGSKNLKIKLSRFSEK